MEKYKYHTNLPRIMATDTVTIPREEYLTLKKKAGVDERLLVSLVQGLEAIKAGKIKPWKSPK